jgi:VWFA-related protein
MLMGLTAAMPGQQQRQKPEEQGEATVELRADLVSFTATVSMPGQKALTTLKREDFVVYENGQPQEVAHFAMTDSPVDIVLLVDVSGSMRDNLDLVKRAAASFVERMRPQDRAAVVSVGRRREKEQIIDVELLADLSPDRDRLNRAIHRIDKGSATAFYDALYLVADEVLREAANRKAMIALTDGVDSASFYDFDKSSDILERTGVTAYFIEVDTEAPTIKGFKKGDFKLSPSQLEKYRRAFRPDDPPFRYQRPEFFTGDEMADIARGLYELARSELRRIAERTGGRVFTLKKFEPLGQIYGEIGAELGTLYSLGYYPTNTKRDGAWRSLRVDVKVPGAKAHARSGYWAPSK